MNIYMVYLCVICANNEKILASLWLEVGASLTKTRWLLKCIVYGCRIMRASDSVLFSLYYEFSFHFEAVGGLKTKKWRAERQIMKSEVLRVVLDVS